MLDLHEQIFARLETDGFQDVLLRLEGRVFHVAKEESLPAIKSAGALLPNRDGKFKSAFGNYENSFFRKRGCISLFDWRCSPDSEIYDLRRRCWPLQGAGSAKGGNAIILLNPIIDQNLISWEDIKKQWNYDEMIVPRVEVGHKGPISISWFDCVLIVRMEEDPNSLASIIARSIPRPAK